ncbi:type I restriction enzyme endonuclease domain-containing protein [Roseococcus suduntuyensis]|uniref:Type I restriction enzyme HindI endonuclease subunit-like C-terminal domain-containing protein n=1 Tax=Roseococcus suduntuyensis TaxID=455361 RepID=A0A840ADN1_9PROT|nr:type I restriction enzyme endonuclease domain-containing protein [Roseococcus suduntuyensis]MBB3899719.1 hypothetical protein [Roseococcus suduntuyensis]
MLPSFVADDSRRRVAAGMMVGDAFRLLAQMLVKRILRKYGCPSDIQDAAFPTVLQQAEALSAARAP